MVKMIKQNLIDDDYEMSSDLVEMERWAATPSLHAHTAQKPFLLKSGIKKSSSPLPMGTKDDKMMGEERMEDIQANKSLEDLITKVKPYYGSLEAITAALTKTFEKGSDRDFFLLSLAYVTQGGQLTELEPQMIPRLQSISKANLGVTKDLGQWKEAFEKISVRLKAGGIIGLGSRISA